MSYEEFSGDRANVYILSMKEEVSSVCQGQFFICVRLKVTV